MITKITIAELDELYGRAVLPIVADRFDRKTISADKALTNVYKQVKGLKIAELSNIEQEILDLQLKMTKQMNDLKSFADDEAAAKTAAKQKIFDDFIQGDEFYFLNVAEKYKVNNHAYNGTMYKYINVTSVVGSDVWINTQNILITKISNPNKTSRLSFCNELSREKYDIKLCNMVLGSIFQEEYNNVGLIISDAIIVIKEGEFQPVTLAEAKKLAQQLAIMKKHRDYSYTLCMEQLNDSSLTGTSVFREMLINEKIIS